MNDITADPDIKAALTDEEAHIETMRNIKALELELVGRIETSVFERFGAKVGVTLLLVDSSGEDSWVSCSGIVSRESRREAKFYRCDARIFARPGKEDGYTAGSKAGRGDVSMKYRPIIFSKDMVNAILDGRKTQTRRLNGLDKINVDPNKYDAAAVDQNGAAHFCYDLGPMVRESFQCPYGKVGERLYVREGFAYQGFGGDSKIVISYLADEHAAWVAAPDDKFSRLRALYSAWGVSAIAGSMKTLPDPLRNRPSIHMPRWASRITLEITNIRVERLQDITEEDAEAEGTPHGLVKADFAFISLWDSINAKSYPWYSNPWVWVLEFKEEA